MVLEGISVSDKIFYHYCSVENFFSIIKSRNLRLCNSYKMNDYMENKYIDVVIDKSLKKLGVDLNNSNIEKLRKNYNRNKAQWKSYISCLSKSGDSLSQWRAYGDDGQGVAIGFNLSKLNIVDALKIEGARLENGVNEHKGLSYSEVIYEENKQVSFVENILSKVLHLTQDVDLLRYVIPMLKNSIIFKNPAFAEEMEVRLIYTIHNQDEKRQIHCATKECRKNFYVKRGQIVSFYEMDFGNHLNEGIIDSIVLGPKCKMSPDDWDMNLFLEQNKIKLINGIRVSDASYR